MPTRDDERYLEKLLKDLCLSPMTRPWAKFFRQEMTKPYFAELDKFVTAKVGSETIYPQVYQIFRAFFVAPEEVRVIILGQDPYHEAGQAMGLAFSVPDTCKAPPSLRNIKKELLDDVGAELPGNNLEGWVEQGVFLLNTVLTVSEGKANSHAGHGWEIFTAMPSNTFLNTTAGRCLSSFGESRLRNTKLCSIKGKPQHLSSNLHIRAHFLHTGGSLAQNHFPKLTVSLPHTALRKLTGEHNFEE